VATTGKFPQYSTEAATNAVMATTVNSTRQRWISLRPCTRASKMATAWKARLDSQNWAVMLISLPTMMPMPR
jgi:hypothetical protein